MQIPELPILPPQIMETLEPIVQDYIRTQADIIALLQEIVQQHDQNQVQFQQRLADLEQRLN